MNGTKPMSQRRPLSAGEPPSLARISSAARGLPNRMLLYAKEGWGKTSFAAQANKPIFLCTKGEDGLETLIQAGQLGEVPHFQDQARTWKDVLGAIDELVASEHAYKTFVLDTLNGAERLLVEYVCEKEFKSDWKDFDAWARGPKMCITGWLELLERLDRLRESKGMAIILLAHSDVATFKNPEGTDYDRYQPALDRKYLWPVTHKWLDMILFGQFETVVEKESKQATKAKALGGQTRLLNTEHRAAFDAKNRHGLPEEIECGESPREAWGNFINALREAKGK